MKPIIKIIECNDGIITFSKAELENLIDKIYDQGYKDGVAASNYTTPSINYPWNPAQPSIWYETNKPYINWAEVTCNDTKTIITNTDTNTPIYAENKYAETNKMNNKSATGVTCDSPHDLRTYRSVEVSDT